MYLMAPAVNTLDARIRSTDFAQTSPRRQKSVGRRHGISAPEVGRPTLFSNAYWHRNARIRDTDKTAAEK